MNHALRLLFFLMRQLIPIKAEMLSFSKNEYPGNLFHTLVCAFEKQIRRVP
jgi:hypothetical protein